MAMHTINNTLMLLFLLQCSTVIERYKISSTRDARGLGG